ncbi:hypothetical protein KXV85_001791, partial [Aspergillus fumigatus]
PGDLRRRSRDRGEDVALDDAVPRAGDGGAQRGARLRFLVLSGGLLGGSGNQEGLRGDGQGGARPQRRRSAAAGRRAKARAPPRCAACRSGEAPHRTICRPHARASRRDGRHGRRGSRLRKLPGRPRTEGFAGDRRGARRRLPRRRGALGRRAARRNLAAARGEGDLK